MVQIKMHLLVCGGTGCRASESAVLVEQLNHQLKLNGLADEVKVITTGCFGFCEKGPIVKVIPDNTFYTNVTPEDAEEIVKEHVLKGRKVNRLLYEDPETLEHVSDSKHMEFYQKQVRIALRNCGFIDPENIDEYIVRDGYAALGQVLASAPKETIDIIKKSGLRGRGGAGFPTGLKWEIAAGNKADQKYVVCNADEGDPGAFMDRSILEGDPNSIIEAMAICGYCIGATKGLIYIRAEYPLAIHRLEIAIKQAREYGLLGKDILGSGFDFDIELRLGAGAFVCGEETALITLWRIPRRTHYQAAIPGAVGYLGNRQTLITPNLRQYSPIILKGGSGLIPLVRRIKGTKVFTCKISNVGLIRGSHGTTLVIFESGRYQGW